MACGMVYDPMRLMDGLVVLLCGNFRLVLRLFGIGNSRSLLIIPPVTARRILSSLIGQEDGVGGATSRPPIQSSLEP